MKTSPSVVQPTQPWYPTCKEGCRDKLKFNRSYSKIMLAKHKKALCAKCLSGRYVWNRYRCTLNDQEKYHVGHWLPESEKFHAYR